MNPFALLAHTVGSRLAEHLGPAEWHDIPYLSHSHVDVELPGNNDSIPPILCTCHVQSVRFFVLRCYPNYGMRVVRPIYLEGPFTRVDLFQVMLGVFDVKADFIHLGVQT